MTLPPHTSPQNSLAHENIFQYALVNTDQGRTRLATKDYAPNGISPGSYQQDRTCAAHGLIVGSNYTAVLSEACAAGQWLRIDQPGKLGPSGAGAVVGKASNALPAGALIVFTYDPGHISEAIGPRKQGADDLGVGGSQTINFDTGEFDNKELSLSVDPTLTVAVPSRSGRYMLWVKSNSATTRSATWLGMTLAAGSEMPPLITQAGQRILMDYSVATGEWTVIRDLDTEKVIDATTIPFGSTFAIDTKSALTYIFDGELPANVTIGVPTSLPAGPVVTIVFRDPQTFVPAFPVGANQYKWYSAKPTHGGPAIYEIKRTENEYAITGSEDGTAVAWWSIGSRLLLRGADTTGTQSLIVNGTARMKDFSRGGTDRQSLAGMSWKMDGVGDYVTSASALSSTDYMITMDFNILVSAQALLLDARDAAGDGLALFYNAGTDLELLHNGTTISIGSNYHGTGWHRIVINKSGSSIKVYLDSDTVTASGTDASAIATTTNVRVGARSFTSATNFLNGHVADVRVATSAASDAEIAEMIALTIGRTSLGKIADLIWFKCDDGSGDIAFNSADPTKHGTITKGADTFHDALGVNDRFSFPNEVGYSPATFFDGSADRYDLGGRATSGAMNAFSVSALICLTDSAAVTSTIASEADSIFLWWFYVSSTKKLVFATSEDGSSWNATTSDAALDLNTLYHVAAVYDGSSRVLYVNGAVFASSGAAPGSPLVDNAADFGIAATGSGSAKWKGYLAKLLFENTDWSAPELAAWHDSGTRPPDSPTQYYFPEANGIEADNKIAPIAATGAPSAANIPRDESDPTKDVAGGLLTYSGQAPHSPILSSPSAEFFGVGDYATDGTSILPTTCDNLTVCGWIQGPSSSLDAMAAEYDEGTERNLFVGTKAGGQAVFYAGSGASTQVLAGTTVLTSDATKWWHIAATFDKAAEEMKIYVMGELEGTLARTASIKGNATPFQVGSARLAGSPHYFSASNMHGIRMWNRTLTQAELKALIAGTEPDETDLLCRYLMMEGDGDVLFDTGPNKKHLACTFASTTASRSGIQQNVHDTILKDGLAVATEYDGTGDYYRHTGLLFSATTKLSVAGWFRTTSSAEQAIVSEYDSAGNQRSWVLAINTSGLLQALISADGGTTNFKQYKGTVNLADGKWHHGAFVFDANTLKLYVDGAAISVTKTSDGTVNALHLSTTGKFTLGAINISSTWEMAGMLSGVVCQAAAWDAATLANIYTGTMPADVEDSHFPDGNGRNKSGTIDITASGTPVRVMVPVGVGLPKTLGPGLMQVGQSIDLTCGEANSPYAKQLAVPLADMDWAPGDGQEVDVVFNDDGVSGARRVIAALPALTGDEKDAMEEYTKDST